ncbi:class I SAM-dependent rRNA methyltransferase [bacterium]|nr:class I SAM-dependent rRNA methyltransferase [bacterium]
MPDAKVILKPRMARPLYSRHPWLFEKAIDRLEGEPAPSDEVQVQTDRGEFVAFGLFNPQSRIRVRLYSWDHEQRVDADLIVRRMKEAIQFRKEALRLDDPRGACRLIYSESDGLSGLIVDRFADACTIQINSLAMERFLPSITQTLIEEVSPNIIVRRTDATVAHWESMTATEEILLGKDRSEPIVFEESGLLFLVDPIRGQKTGGYLDQRDNRRSAAFYAAGRDVLDAFCYAGGFGLTASKLGHARSVTFLDSSAEAKTLAEKNAQANDIPATFLLGDAGRMMGDLAREGRKFGMVVCDPPKFASKASEIEGALRGYEFINRSAIHLLEPGGILVSCSCSGLITPSDFLEMLAESAIRAGREIRVLEMRGQAPDHPVSLACPETAYLKCVIARVV